MLDRWHLTYYKGSKPPAKGATPSKRFALSSLQAPEFATPEGLRSVTLATRDNATRFTLQFPLDIDMALWREHLENWITRVDSEVIAGGETLRTSSAPYSSSRPRRATCAAACSSGRVCAVRARAG